MKEKELKQRLSRLQSKVEDVKFQLGRLIAELDIDLNKEEK
jgi:hypothetical protein